MLFYLEVARGTDFNSGALYGELTFNNKGCYEYNPPEKEDGCKLRFVKNGNKISIVTVRGDCGFGYGVYADGSFTLQDSKNPVFMITRTGKKVYFDKTAPEKFKED